MGSGCCGGGEEFVDMAKYGLAVLTLFLILAPNIASPLIVLPATNAG
jgi:hypothetical protein